MQGEGSQNICVSTGKVYSMLLCICNVRAEPQINRLLLQRPRGWCIKDVRRDGGHVGQMRTRVKALADVRKLVLFYSTMFYRNCYSSCTICATKNIIRAGIKAYTPL